MKEFDYYAGNYQECLDNSLKLAGSDSLYFSNHKAMWLTKFFSPSFAGKILDFGCGVGLLTDCLQRQLPKAELHGFDVSAESISRIPANLKNIGNFSTELSQLGYDYDAIIISNVLHHIPLDERQKTIDQLSQRLTQSGKLIVFEHNVLNPLTRYVVKHCPFDEDAILLPRKETRNYMQQANLKIHTNHYVMFFPKFVGFLNRFEKHLSWCPAGAQYVMVGTRE